MILRQVGRYGSGNAAKDAACASAIYFLARMLADGFAESDRKSLAIAYDEVV